ncbi:MAG TPA: hypothetical protein VMA71_10145 [Alloacidobacterium sp.]|nr:hypothetical protein [Alloacidobacterium sp.]
MVDENGSLLTAMPGKITLTVSVEIPPADATPAMHRVLPYSGVHGSAFPLNVARESDVHR